MTLNEIIEVLSKLPLDLTVEFGLGNPHSYRGYYDDLAFEPEFNMTVGVMYENAIKALGAKYPGYKGGTYLMEGETPCYLAYEGCCGELITEEFFSKLKGGCE